MAKNVIWITVTFAIVAALSVSFFLFSSKKSIVGYFFVDFYNQDISLIINDSKSFVLTTEHEDNFTITSFALSGIIEGGGRVKAYINNGGKDGIVILDNLKKTPSSLGSLTAITGMGSMSKGGQANIGGERYKLIAIKPMEEQVFESFEGEEDLFEGYMQNECIDSCHMGLPISKNITHRLVFLVQNGTLLRLTNIIYQYTKQTKSAGST